MRVLNVTLTLKSNFLTEIKISLKIRCCFQEQEELKARAVPGATPGNPGAVVSQMEGAGRLGFCLGPSKNLLVCVGGGQAGKWGCGQCVPP